jgi:hypothetical protein
MIPGTPTMLFAAFDMESLVSKEQSMARRMRHSPEQVMELRRQIDESIANGKTTAQSCLEAKITMAMYLRWRREYSGGGEAQAKRIRELEQENVNLKRLVSELCLQKLALRDIIASGGL